MNDLQKQKQELLNQLAEVERKIKEADAIYWKDSFAFYKEMGDNRVVVSDSCIEFQQNLHIIGRAYYSPKKAISEAEFNEAYRNTLKKIEDAVCVKEKEVTEYKEGMTCYFHTEGKCLEGIISFNSGLKDYPINLGTKIAKFTFTKKGYHCDNDKHPRLSLTPYTIDKDGNLIGATFPKFK